MARRPYRTGALAKKLAAKDKAIREAANASASEAAKATVKKLSDTVATWRNKPIFRFVAEKPIIRLILAGGTEKAVRIFGYVDKGTKPHRITPKTAKALRFFEGYSARTKPIANYKAGSGKASGDVVYSRGVNHPGNEAREFSEVYALEAVDLIRSDLKMRLRKL